jgi:hypothetical protein
MRILLVTLFVCAVALFSGCQSPAHTAAPDAVAAVEVMDVSELDCAMAIRKAFLRAGYEPKPKVDSRLFVYEKVAGKVDEFMYGGWGMAPVKIRVKVGIVGLEARHYVITANPYTVRDSDDIRLEDEKKTHRNRKMYQAMLDQIRDELVRASAPPVPAASPAAKN